MRLSKGSSSSNASETDDLVGQRERERELRREGGKSLLAYVKGVDPHLIHIDRPTTIRSPEHRSGWVNYPPAYVIWVDGCVARTAGRGDVPYAIMDPCGGLGCCYKQMTRQALIHTKLRLVNFRSCVG